MSTRTSAHTLRILMLGPVPPPFGGTTALFTALAEALDGMSDTSVEVVDTSGVRGSGPRAPLRFIGVFMRTLAAAFRADVVALHGSTTGLFAIGPLAAVAAGLTARPLLIRKFGGSSVLELEGPRRALALWSIRRADAYLVETKMLLERERLGGLAGVRWYPNSRRMPELSAGVGDVHRRCSRFVFLGQMRSEKGVREILEVAEELPSSVSIDMYGPTGFDVSIEELSAPGRLNYLGVVPQEDVHDLLLSYDALIMPTHSPGEGYPGVILEAYAAGLPVIATRWAAIPEIVDETTGLLLEPHNARELRKAMLNLHTDVDMFTKLRAGVMERRGEFSAERWERHFAALCRGLVR